MKKSYVKILILEITLILVMLFNSFVMNNRNVYIPIITLSIGYLLLRLLLGKEKKNFRYSKDITLLIVIYTIMFLLLTYVLGVITEFSKSVNYWNFLGLRDFIVPTILTIVITEIFRENLMRKAELSKILLVLGVVMFIISDLILVINASTFTSAYSSLMFFAYFFLPIVARNILCSFLCYKVGYRSSIIYRLIMECYTFIIPIYPNFGDYINSIIRIIVPSLLMMTLSKKIKDQIRSDIYVSYSKKFITIRNGVAIILIALCVYLTCGSFEYFTLAIGSGSMMPVLHKGDMVIVEKLSEKEKEELEIGDILAYQKDGITVVHRIVDIYKDQKEFIVYTQGDANNFIDNYPIDTSMMVGTVKLNIPFIGYPSIIVNERLNKE